MWKLISIINSLTVTHSMLMALLHCIKQLQYQDLVRCQFLPINNWGTKRGREEPEKQATSFLHD